MQRAGRKKRPKKKDTCVGRGHILSFYRAVRLPTSVKEEGSTAKMENGVLTITLPKMQLEEPVKKIAIE